MKVYVAGIRGMVGSAIANEASRAGHQVFGKSSKELDFCNREKVFLELEKEKPDAIFIAAAKVGGIGANSSSPVDFLSQNLQIQTNVIDASFSSEIDKVVFLGSSCIYPKMASQPIREDYLLTGKLEETNEAYAIAKIAGVKLIESYRKQFGKKWMSVMPTNLYGEGDNFEINSSHVIPALINKFHTAKIMNEKSVYIWGDGSPFREFLHVSDLAKACVLLLEDNSNNSILNIGSSYEISIAQLAELVRNVVGYSGTIEFDLSKPNGTPRKLLDSTKILEMGWKPLVDLKIGISRTYNWFLRELEIGTKF
jgi:GDP-L-fucose synthase